MSLLTNSASHSPNIEAFLFADIGAQSNGVPLTILSLLALAGLDPWAEAERLSHMPRSAAISYMIAEINRAPAVYRNQTDVAQLAKSLVAHLPTHDADARLNISAIGRGFKGIPMVPFMMMFFGTLTIALLALLLAGR